VVELLISYKAGKVWIRLISGELRCVRVPFYFHRKRKDSLRKRMVELGRKYRSMVHDDWR